MTQCNLMSTPQGAIGSVDVDRGAVVRAQHADGPEDEAARPEDAANHLNHSPSMRIVSEIPNAISNML